MRKVKKGAQRRKPPADDSKALLIPRMPSRGPGFARYEALVAATENLLMTESPDAIGLYQIAEHAGVPPASVYHFFPSKDAAFVALSRHYVEQLEAVINQPIEASQLNSWQDLMTIDLRRSMDFHNAHPPMMKINFGGYGGVMVRTIDHEITGKLARSNYSRLNRIFHMPPLRNAEEIFEMRLAIVEAVLGLSFRRHGELTERYFKEALNAGIAFMSQFLPSRVDPREELLEAAARKQTVLLPLGELLMAAVTTGRSKPLK